MNRLFEYEGLRNILMNKSVRDELVDYFHNPFFGLEQVSEYLMGLGLECHENAAGFLVVHVHKSPRKRPACAIIGEYPIAGSKDVFGTCGYVISTFEAGEFNVAGSREAA